MSLHDQFKEDERAGFIKQIADKLFQGIVEAYDTPESQKRRWIWELVQNAKDVKNAFGSVLIRVTIDKGFVLFEHNGDPFHTKSLTGLIQQVSSKDSASNSAATTGKFGTGFISTHMLSKKITVNGLLAYGDYYKQFEIELDRDAATPEELSLKVEKLLQTKDSLTNDALYPPLPVANNQRTKESFDSKFRYVLKPETEAYSKQGIEDLIRTGPYALLINDKIGQFEIVDRISGTTTIIKKAKRPLQNYPIDIFSAELSGTSKPETISLVYKTDSSVTMVICMPAEVTAEGITALKPLPYTVPVLFKEFPLIGTEAWMFGFVCHSEKFQPKEPRDGLRLHIETEEDSGQAKINREVLFKAVELALVFAKELSEVFPAIANLHMLAKSGLPAIEQKDDVVVFLTELQEKYRRAIKAYKIVQTAEGPKAMTECRFPVLEQRDLPGPDPDISFFRLCFFRNHNLLPLEDHYIEWREILAAEPYSWGSEMLLTLNDVLEETKQWTNISSIRPSDMKSEKTAVGWLNDLLKFLTENKLETLHKDFALIPNQKGELILLTNAIRDADKNIPEVLKDVAEAFDKKYRLNLADDRILCNELYNILTIEGISKELASDIGNLKKPEALDQVQLNALITLCRIPTGFSTADDQRRDSMVDHLSSMIPEWRSRPEPLPAMSDFNFNPAMRVIVRWCLYHIANQEKLSVLQGLLHEKNTEEKVVLWIDRLIELVIDYDDFSSYLETNAIYPNQLGNLCLRKPLSADVDLIPEDIKNIHDSILSNLGLRKNLLHIHIAQERVDSKITFLQVAGEIEQELRTNAEGLDSLKIRDAALSMINWLADEQNALYRHYFSWIEDNKAAIVLKSLDKDRENIFKILRANKDFKKLASIAENKDFDTIAELAESGYNIEELKKIHDMAVQAGGVDVVEKKLENFLEENQDMAFRMELGTHVENLFRDIFKSVNPLFDVRRDPVGQDFVLYVKDTTWEYRVEIKSFATGRAQVHMSMRQGETASDHPEHYALCVLERPPKLKDADKEYFKAHALFVPDIGIHLKDRVEAAKVITDILDEHNTEEGGIDFDSRDYKYRIGKKIFTGSSSQKFDRFLQEITDQIKKITV